MEKSKMLQTTTQNKSQNLPGGASKFVTRSNSLDPNQKRLETLRNASREGTKNKPPAPKKTTQT
jgi:hypothetical protein